MRKTVLDMIVAVMFSRLFEILIIASGENISLYERTCLWLLIYLCVKRVLE